MTIEGQLYCKNDILRSLSLGYTPLTIVFKFSSKVNVFYLFICTKRSVISSYDFLFNMYSLFIFRNNYFTLSKQPLRSSSKRNTFILLYLIDFCYYYIKYTKRQ